MVEGTDIFLDDLLTLRPAEMLGGLRYDCLVKYLDSAIRLPVQVHPTPAFSEKHFASPYGKTEAWLVLAKRSEDACLYFGFKDRIDLDTLKAYADRSLEEKDILTELINPVKVEPGDVYLIRAGLIHAIGAGCLICEIQQSSNITYRLYDYGRKDGLGRMRELHIDKALDVINMRAVASQTFESYRPVAEKVNAGTVVGQCKYFSVSKYVVDGSADVPPSDSSFAAFVVVSGSGSISDGRCNYKFQPGDTFFAAAKEQISIKGNAEILSAKV